MCLSLSSLLKFFPQPSTGHCCTTFVHINACDGIRYLEDEKIEYIIYTRCNARLRRLQIILGVVDRTFGNRTAVELIEPIELDPTNSLQSNTNSIDFEK